MEQIDPIISISILLTAALVGGMIAHRLKQPVILGYLLIGVAIGPHALGLIQDEGLIQVTATIGVALLMFTIGLEISISQLKSVGKAGILSAILQILVTFCLGYIAAHFLLKWQNEQAVLFGLIISLSSTAVCLKVLMDRAEMNTVQGRLMIAILIIQDISVVVMALILPLLGDPTTDIWVELGLATGKAILFIAIAIVLGRWVLPFLMGRIGGVRSRELFLLTILVLCLGAAIGTYIFGLSMVFGTFLIGLILRETKFAHQALAEITPLRDIFATLFFVSLGMLLNPFFVAENWIMILIILVVVFVIKIGVIIGVVRLLGYSNRVAILSGAGLFQIGEFGFILAQAGINQGFFTDEAYSFVVATAIISMLLTPLAIGLSVKISSRMTLKMGAKMAAELPEQNKIPEPAVQETSGKVIIAGYGRVGRNLARALDNADIPYIIVDIDPERISDAHKDGRPRIFGDASNTHVLTQAGIQNTKALVITFPDPVGVLTTVKIAKTINPDIQIIARVHRAQDARDLQKLGVTQLISPEYEAGFKFLKTLLNLYSMDVNFRRLLYEKIKNDQKMEEFSKDDSG
jgi:CPA2 family monovalent cation:H+ antiporter-2